MFLDPDSQLNQIRQILVSGILLCLRRTAGFVSVCRL